MSGNRAVTIRCRVCGLEVVGVEREGGVYPSDRSRPEPGAPVRDGLCAIHGDLLFGRRHAFHPGPDPLACAICGRPYQSVTRGRDPNHPAGKMGRSTR